MFGTPNPDEIAQGYRVGIKVDFDDYDLTPANELQGYNYQEPLVQVEKPANRPGNNNFGWRNTVPTPAPQRRGYQAYDTILDDPFFNITSIDNGIIIDQTRAKIHFFQDVMEDIVGFSPRSALHDTAKGFGNGFKELFEFGYHAVTDPVGTGGRLIDTQINLDKAIFTALFDLYTTSRRSAEAYRQYAALSRREQATRQFEFAGWVASQVVIGEASGAPFRGGKGSTSIFGGEVPNSGLKQPATKLREVEVEPPHFDTPEEFYEYAQRRSDPQGFIDNFVNSLKGRKPSEPPRYDPNLASSGSAVVGAGAEVIKIGDKGLVRDSELFKTIFHEEGHLRLMEKARQGNSRALDLVTNPNANFEELYVERFANRYFNLYERKYGPFKH